MRTGATRLTWTEEKMRRIKYTYMFIAGYLTPWLVGRLEARRNNTDFRDRDSTWDCMSGERP